MGLLNRFRRRAANAKNTKKRPNTPVKTNAGTPTNRALTKAALTKALTTMNKSLASWDENEQAFLRWAGLVKSPADRTKYLAHFNATFRPLLKAMKKQRDEVRARGVIVQGPFDIRANGTTEYAPGVDAVWRSTYTMMLAELPKRPLLAASNAAILKRSLHFANKGILTKNDAPLLFAPGARAKVDAYFATSKSKNNAAAAVARAVANKAVRGAATKANLANLNSLRAQLAACERKNAELSQRLSNVAFRCPNNQSAKPSTRRKKPPTIGELSARGWL